MRLPEKHFVLIGNYPPDGQESMIRFTGILAEGLRSHGMTAEIVVPRPIVLGALGSSGKGLKKWLAYVDKWILFPLALRRIVQRKQRELGGTVHYHICDHSNAPYLAHLPVNSSAITCHDVLAIRGALGHADSYCAASRTGVILQRWILKNLGKARRIACVSRLTLRQLCEATKEQSPRRGWTVLHNAFNAPFGRIESGEAARILQRQGISIPQPFLLHVGSNLPRKNRRMLLQMITQKGKAWRGDICFAGEPAEAALKEEAQKLGIWTQVHSVSKPDHESLCALYSLAHAFVFPSLSEGFGWPLIEAQACGTPVIASDLEPLPEVSGGAALHANPHDSAAFATALSALNDSTMREDLIDRGLENTKRFDLSTMIEGYLALHGITGVDKLPAIANHVA